LLGTVTPYIVIIIFGILIKNIFVKDEERMLKNKFGEVCLKYKEKVRRWL